MDNFIETLIFASVLIIIALIFLGLGWLITGKQKIRGGTCGRDPTKERDGDCSTKSACQLCDKKPKSEKED
ncbi:MAG: hypothetical protein VX777_08320 [Chlamydiota bacterium]|nr:hypothetical protein [Chlamydiota bacterium]